MSLVNAYNRALFPVAVDRMLLVKQSLCQFGRLPFIPLKIQGLNSNTNPARDDQTNLEAVQK